MIIFYRQIKFKSLEDQIEFNAQNIEFDIDRLMASCPFVDKP